MGDGMGSCTSWRPQVSCVRGSHRQGAQLMGAIRSQLWTGEAHPPISGGWDQGFSCPVLSHQPLPAPPPRFLTARETTANSRLQWGKEHPQVRFFQRVASVIPWANRSFAHRVGADGTSQKVTYVLFLGARDVWILSSHICFWTLHGLRPGLSPPPHLPFYSNRGKLCLLTTLVLGGKGM